MPRLSQLAFQQTVALPRPRRTARPTPRPFTRRGQQRQLRLVTESPAPLELPPGTSHSPPPSAPVLDPLALSAAFSEGQAAVRSLVLDAPLGDALVGSGDTLIISERTPRDGELVLVEGTDGARRLRRIYHEGDFVRLQPEDRAVVAERARAADIEIIGTIITIVRRQRRGV